MTIEKYITPHVQAGEIKHRVTKWLGQVKGSTFDIFLQPEINHTFRNGSRRTVQNDYSQVLKSIIRVAAQQGSKAYWGSTENLYYSDHDLTDFTYFTNSHFAFSDPYLEYLPFAVDDQDYSDPTFFVLRDLIKDNLLSGNIVEHVDLNGFESEIHHGFDYGHPIPNAVSVALQAGMYQNRPETNVNVRRPIKNASEIIYFPQWVVPITAYRVFEKAYNVYPEDKDFLDSVNVTTGGAVIFDSLRGKCIDTTLGGSDVDAQSYNSVELKKPWFGDKSSRMLKIREEQKSKVTHDLKKFRGSI